MSKGMKRFSIILCSAFLAIALSFAIGCADKSSGEGDVSMASTLVSQVSESHQSHSSAISSSTTTLSSGNYYLSGNVTLSSCITVTGTVHICLNGKTLTGKSSAVIIVDGGTLYLHDCSSSGSGKITGGVGAMNIWSNASMGGGISIVNKGTLHMYGGNITGNKSDVCGGGVMMDGTASMVMYGGTISNNSTGYLGGGGIYCAGSLLMTGGTISGNSASASGSSYPTSGGVSVGNVSSYYGTFEMTGGTISGNSAYYGGGVATWSSSSGSTTFKMSGGTISGNTATYEGGGIYNDGTLTITGGTISGNTCKTSSTSYGGGGICMTNGSASVSNAEISGNTASGCSGGGINVYSGCTMTLSGCTITGNSASKYGGGIYFSGTLKMSGKMIVHANSGSDVYLQTSQYITLSGKLTSGADVGVYFYSSSQSQVTASESSTTYYKTSYSYFFSNRNNNLLPSYSSYVYFLSSTSSAYFSSTFYMASGYSSTRYYTDLSSAVASADVSYNSAATVKPLKAATVSSYVTISSGTSITFDLNNYTVTGSSYLFSVSGSLTITDSSSSGNGKITGCSSSYGAIYVKSGGSLTISGGTLTGNYSTGYGGAVYLASSTSSSFSMTGGKITGNTAKSGGAGIYVTSKGVAYFSGSAYVYDNTVSGKQNNIYIASGANINFSSSSNVSKVTLGVTAAGTGSSAVQITNTVSGISSYYSNILPDSSACEYVSSNAVYLSDSHTCGTFFTYNEDGTALVEVICKYCGDETRETRNVLYKVENGVAKKYVEGYEDESTETLSSGFLVEDEDGRCVYYTDLAEASAGASSGSTLYILEDISSGEIMLGGGVTIDLGGHTVEADIVSSGTVKIIDTNSENTGEVSGGLSGGTFILEGGIYSGSEITLGEIEDYTNWDDGYVVYVSSEGYEVLKEDSAKEKSAACVKYTASDGVKRTVYFESLNEAITYVSECEYAVEMTLLEDVEGDLEISGVDITLNLDGREVSGEVKISGENVTVNFDGGCAGSLGVSSSVGEVKINIDGSSLGSITVSGASEVEISVGTDKEGCSTGDITITDSKNVKIDISSGEAGDITVSGATEVKIEIGEEAIASSVDVSAESGIEIEVSGTVTGAATVSGTTSEISIEANASVGGIEIKSGDAGIDLNGASTGYVKVSTSGEVNISLDGGSITGAVEVSLGTVTIEAGEGTGNTGSSSSVGSIEVLGGSLTLDLDGGEIEGDVAVSGGSLNLNLGEEGKVSGDIEVCGGTAEICMGKGSSVGDVTVSGGSLVLDLLGGTVEGNLTASGSGSLTVEDSSSEKTGTVDGKISSEGSSSIKLHAGTYNESVEGDETEETESSGVLTYVDWAGSYVAVYDDENKTYTVTTSMAESEAADLGYGALVTYEDENENTVTIYYSSLTSAVENAPDGSTVKLLCDTEENTDITFSSKGTCGITLDLNGHTINGGITVEAGASVKIVDESATGQDKGYNAGTVTGNITVEAEGSLTITAGTYYDKTCENYFPTGELYVAAIDIIFEDADTGGKTPTYTYIVMTEETAEGVAADAYATVGGNTGNANKTYYIDLEDALFDISSTGGYVTVLKDSESEWENAVTISGGGVEVTIDLCGHNVFVSLVVEAGSVENSNYTAGATLLIEDTSTESSSSGGSISGTITVEGKSADSGTSESGQEMTYTNSFAGTLLISKTVSSVSNLSVTTSLSSEAGTVGYTFGLLYEGSSEYTEYGENYAYGIIAGHQCVYNYSGATWSISPDGVVSLIFVCVECKNPETDEEGEIVSYTKDIKNSSDEITCTVTYSDGVVTVSYTASITMMEEGKGYYTNEQENCHTYSSEGQLSITAEAEVVFTDASEDSVTLYFEDIDTALLTIKELLAEEDPGYTSAEIILLSDAECDFEISSGEVTINLNGFSIDGDVTVSEGAQVTIKDDATVSDGSSGTIKGDSGSNVNGEIFVEEGGSLTLEAGRYIDRCVEYFVAEGCIVSCEITSGVSYYTVEKIDDAQIPETYVAKAVVTVGEGEDALTYGIYYTSLEDALADAAAGETIVILAGCEAVDDTFTVDKNLTIDLGGNTVAGDIEVLGSEVKINLEGGEILGDITVEGAATLVIDGSAGSDAEPSYGVGTVIGEIAVEEGSTLVVEGGAYSRGSENDTYDNYDEVVGNLADGAGVVYVGEMTYTDGDSEEKTVTGLTIVSEEYALANAEASRTYMDENGKEITVYYESLEAAVADLEDGDVLVVLKDVDLTDTEPGKITIEKDVVIDLNDKTLTANIEVSGASVDINLDGGEIKGDVTVGASEDGTSSDVTINLGGGKIDGDISVDETSSLTIIDEGGKASGNVAGKIETKGGSLVVEGGIYSENVLDFVADGKVMYVGNGGDDKKYYVVTTGDAMKEAMEGEDDSYTIGASVTYTDEDGKETTVYFEDPVDAIDFAVGPEGVEAGSTVTVELYGDLTYESGEGITTEKGDDIVINLNGNTITGDITVTGGSSLTIDLEGGTVAGGITVGDAAEEATAGEAFLVIEDSSEGKNGSVTGEIKKGEYSEESAKITIEGGTYYGGDVFDFLGDGKVEYVGKGCTDDKNYYVVGTKDEIEESDLEIGAKVTYTIDGGETVTIYFEDPADAVDYALSLSGVEEGSAVLVELFGDLDYSKIESKEGITIETSYAVEIDLNGNSISGDITVESGSSLTVRDANGDMSGGVSGGITVNDGGTFVAEGGTYSEDVFDFLGEGKVEYVGKDSESKENYFVVGKKEEIENSDLEIGAKVVYTNESGDIVTVYFEDPVDAIDFAVGVEDVEDGTTVLVELYTDLDYTDVTNDEGEEVSGIETKEGNDITINLNGNSVIGDITVKARSSLTIEDTDPKDYGEGSLVYGEVTIETDGELKIFGGMYTGDITDATLDSGSFVLILTTDEGERISVVADEETAKAYSEVSVEMDGKTVYYGDIDEAIENILAALGSDDYDGEEIIMTVYGENVVIGEGGFNIPSGSVTIDLNGGALEGSISLGGEDGSGEVSLTFTDSSDEGSGKFEGKVTGGENAEITLDGGTYSKDAFDGCDGSLEYGTYKDEEGKEQTYVPVYGSEFIYVVPESEAEKMSVACVEGGDGSREYFTDVENAIDFAAENGGIVTLYDDAVCRESVEIYADVTIDLNGHTLDADIIIYADNDEGQGKGGSLYVTGSKDEGGWLTGEIVVVGSDTSEDGTNPYKETLVLDFEEMDGSLTISVVDENGDGLRNFVFSETEDGYGIVRADEHTHSYVLAVWDYAGYGKFTLSFKCACGEYDEFLETYTAEAKENEDGTVTFTLTVTVMDPSHAGTYEYEKTMSFAAKVSINGETVYFDDLDEAITAAIESGATLILMCGVEDGLSLADGESLTIDLNGNELSGEIKIEEGASLEIEGEGVVTSEISGDGELIIRGGTYYEDVEEYLDAGYAVMVGTDKDGKTTYTVLSESAAKESSEASVTGRDGNTTYYESLEDALAALENGCTLTLQTDIEENLIIDLTNESESVKVGLDLNGYEIWGDVIIEADESESFSLEISDSSADGKRGYGKILGEIEGADSVTLFGGNYESDISSYDIAEGFAIINNADGSKSVVPEGVAKELSGAVIEADGDTYYYELLQDAVAAAEGMDEESSVVMTANCLSDVTITGSVEVDLNGFEIEGDVHVEAEASLTFIDSSEGCEGVVSGDVLGSGDVTLSGGTFRADAFKETTYKEGDEEGAEEVTESVNVELEEDTVVVIGRGEDGELLFTVMTEDEAEKFGYTKVETTGENGDSQTLFFTDFDEAINYAARFGGTVTLYSDEIMSGSVTISAEVEIDLNGHTLCADITIDTERYPGASLEVTCGGGEGGKITGSLTIIVEDSEKDENPYEETLKISSAVDIGNLETSIIDVAGTAAQNYFLTEDETESSYVIGMGTHEHTYDIAGWVYDEKTCTFTFILKCACGDVFVTETIDAEFNYDENTNTVTVSAETETKNANGEPYTFEVTFTPEARLTVYDEDGEVESTYYFESLEDAIAYVAALEEARASLEEGEGEGEKIVSEITLLSDVENVEIAGGAYITIDLNGKEISGTVSVDEDSSLIISGSGTIDAALDIRGDVTLSGDEEGIEVYPDETLGIAEGGVLTVEGNVEIILNFGDSLDIGYYFEEEGGELVYESGLIIEGDLLITVTGDSEILAGDGTFISEDGSLTIVVESGAALTIDTCGTEVEAMVTLEGRSSLEVVDSSSSGEGKVDGTVTVFEGAFVSLYDGTYKDYPEGLEITFVGEDGTTVNEDMLMESAMAEDGEKYVRSTTEKEHKASGHSYDLENCCVELAGDEATFYELDAETSEIVMYFTCYCGEKLSVRIHITEDDYFSEAAKNAEGDMIVRVLYNNLSVTVTSSNGISASYLLHGETVLEMFTEAEEGVRSGEKEYDGYDGKEYRYYYIYEPAGCDHTGEDIYIYGSYSGVVVRETVGITHTGLYVYGEKDGHTIYCCSDCERYFIDNTSVSASDAYDLSEVEKELEREQSFNETKKSLEESLDMAITGCTEEGGSIWGIYSDALDELNGREYEFTGGEERDAYLEELTAEIEDIVANALFEIAEENQRGQTKNALESFFGGLLSEDNQSFLDEYYSEDAQEELREIYDAVMEDIKSADFGFTVYDEDAGSSYADYTEYLEGKYSEYIENVIARVNAVDVKKVDADENESDSDVIYSFISNDAGISGVIKLVIEKSDDKKLDKKIKNAELVSGDGEIEDGKLAEYIEDKSVVGVYDFSLWDTSSNARVYVFSGVYYVCLQLPEELKGRDDLVIVYLGDDGVLEVYLTSVSEDGEYLYFSTTHFSEYIILGDSQRDLTAVIIVLAVVGGVALIALIILLVIFILRKRDENGRLVKETKTAALAPAALLLVTTVPSGAIGIIIALSVVDAALIAGAIVMAWLVSTKTQKNAVLELPAENESLASSPLNNFTEYDPSNPDGDVEIGKSENSNQ